MSSTAMSRSREGRALEEHRHENRILAQNGGRMGQWTAGPFASRVGIAPPRARRGERLLRRGMPCRRARDRHRMAETAFASGSEASRARPRGRATPEREANKVPGFPPYWGGDFVFRSADTCRMGIGRAPQKALCNKEILERAKGFEPSTPTLARLCSTPELHPHPRRVRRPTGQRTRAAALLCQRATGFATLAQGANPPDRRGGLDRLDADCSR
jgi:hypothetical protein